jgi:hypothetical protein
MPTTGPGHRNSEIQHQRLARQLKDEQNRQRAEHGFVFLEQSIIAFQPADARFTLRLRQFSCSTR